MQVSKLKCLPARLATVNEWRGTLTNWWAPICAPDDCVQEATGLKDARSSCYSKKAENLDFYHLKRLETNFNLILCQTKYENRQLKPLGCQFVTSALAPSTMSQVEQAKNNPLVLNSSWHHIKPHISYTLSCAKYLKQWHNQYDY